MMRMQANTLELYLGIGIGFVGFYLSNIHLVISNYDAFFYVVYYSC